MFITIGTFNNISALLKSQPDEISDKTGIELVCDSVKFFSENCPVKIIYSPCLMEEEISTGKTLSNTSDDNPVKIAYDIYIYRWQRYQIQL